MISKLFVYGNEKGSWQTIREDENSIITLSYTNIWQLNGNYVTGSTTDFNQNYGMYSTYNGNVNSIDFDYYSYEDIYRP
jgi:hypothetical protein